MQTDNADRPDDAALPAGRPLRSGWRKFVPLAVIVAALVAFYLAGLHRELTLEAVIRNHARLAAAVETNFAGAVLGYLAIYTAAVALSFPGASFLTIAGGFLFGAALGTPLALVAATTGACLLFLAARTSLGGVLRKRAGRFARRFADGFAKNAFTYLLLLRLVPLFPFSVVNLVPALFDVPLRTYAAATAIGIIPGTVAYSLLGQGLGGVIAAQERANPGCADAGTCEVDFGSLLTPGLMGALVLLSVVALVPLAVKRWRGSPA